MADIDSMIPPIRRRGPDADGTVLLNNDQVALGHTRLSILDLSVLGNQPLTNEDESVWLTYNGEIYNYRELRSELQTAGHRFRSDTDSEVVVHGYEEWGIDCVRRFQGIFAFGLWDQNQRQLVLARDQIGVKPLYLAHSASGIMFASTPSAILGCRGVQADVDPEAFRSFLFYGTIPLNQCIYQGIEKLRAAELITVSADQKLKRRVYWKPPAHVSRISFDEAVEESDRLIGQAVKRQMVSDVPVGTLLSGGVDSSLVTSCAQQADGEVQAFTIGFEESDLDERSFARIIADDIGIEHHERVLNANAFYELMPDIIDAYDEPIYLSSAVSYFSVSGFARERGVKVLLSGDGGDELFCGYSRYLEFKRNQPRLKTRLKDFALRSFGHDRANERFLGSFFAYEGLLRSDSDAHLFGEYLGPGDHLWRYRVLDSVDSSTVRRAQLLDFHSFLVDEALSRTDRASMYFGVEVRVPLLDLDVVEFALSIPPEVNLHGDVLKSPVRSLVARRFPDGGINQQKRGFSSPLHRWVAQLFSAIPEYLADGGLAAAGLLQPDALRRLDSTKRAKCCWLLACAELWYRRWILNESAPEVSRSFLKFVGTAC